MRTYAQATITQIASTSQIQAAIPVVEAGIGGAGWSFTTARFPKGMNRGFPWCKDSFKCQTVSRGYRRDDRGS